MIPLIKFNNEDLSFDIQKIKFFPVPITVAKSFEATFDYPYGLDVEDTTYWYAEEKERNEDFEKLKSIVSRFSSVELYRYTKQLR